MARFRFGVGEYKYFAAPVPPLVAELREVLYPRVVPIANDWAKALRLGTPFPSDFAEFIEICHRQGQTKPAPLILRYEAGGYNCMHQDLYGDVVFPIQFTFMLSRRGADYSGGEFMLLSSGPAPSHAAMRLRWSRAQPFSSRRVIARSKARAAIIALTSGMV